MLRHVIAEVHNTYGAAPCVSATAGQRRHGAEAELYVSPFNDVDGYYLVRAPRPTDTLAVSISLHRTHQPPFTAAMRGARVPARGGQFALLQLTVPAAPMMGALRIRIQGIRLWLRRVPVVSR